MTLTPASNLLLSLCHPKRGIVGSPEQYSQTKGGPAELVALRNELMCHFLERFDLFDSDGCRAAVIHAELKY